MQLKSSKLVKKISKKKVIKMIKYVLKNILYFIMIFANMIRIIFAKESAKIFYKLIILESIIRERQIICKHIHGT